MSADLRPGARVRWIAASAAFAMVLSVAVWACTRPNAAYCDEDTPCAETGMACNFERNECVATDLDGDTCQPGACPAGAPICDDDTGQCRSCASGETGDSECAALDPDAPICSTGVCVGCERPADCPAPAPWCSDNECVPCQDGAGGDSICSQRNPSEPYCLDGACVACRGDEDCAVDTPVCESSEGLCRGCERGSECDTGICDVPTGACALEEEILFVDGDDGADGEGCGAIADPCASISGAEGALAQVDGDRAFIFVRARPSGERYRERILVDEGFVAILGEGQAFGEGGARLEHSGTSPIVQVSGGASLWLEGVRLSGDIDIGESGIECSSAQLVLERVELSRFVEHAISSEGCQLTVQSAAFRDSGDDQLVLISGSDASIVEATISGGDARGIYSESGRLALHRVRVEGNDLGGVDVVNSAIDLVNNVIADNGSVSASEFGGIRIRITQSIEEGSRFAFNTVARNHVSDEQGLAHGVDCDGYELRATSNIVYSGFGGLEAVSEGCGWGWAYSNIQDGIEIDPGSGNFSQNPRFVDEAALDFRLDSESPCIGRGEPGTGIDEDIEGRPRPDDEAPSCGAYEP